MQTSVLNQQKKISEIHILTCPGKFWLFKQNAACRMYCAPFLPRIGGRAVEQPDIDEQLQESISSPVMSFSSSHIISSQAASPELLRSGDA